MAPTEFEVRVFSTGGMQMDRGMMVAQIAGFLPDIDISLLEGDLVDDSVLAEIVRAASMIGLINGTASAPPDGSTTDNLQLAGQFAERLRHDPELAKVHSFCERHRTSLSKFKTPTQMLKSFAEIRAHRRKRGRDLTAKEFLGDVLNR